VEAYIDFSEDQNIEDDILSTTNNIIKSVKHQIQVGNLISYNYLGKTVGPLVPV
jgi:hypothetical protein